VRGLLIWAGIQLDRILTLLHRRRGHAAGPTVTIPYTFVRRGSAVEQGLSVECAFASTRIGRLSLPERNTRTGAHLATIIASAENRTVDHSWIPTTEVVDTLCSVSAFSAKQLAVGPISSDPGRSWLSVRAADGAARSSFELRSCCVCVCCFWGWRA